MASGDPGAQPGKVLPPQAGGGRAVRPTRGSGGLRAGARREQGPLPGGRAAVEAVVAKRSFVLHFQPIVSLLDGSVRHHEALLRVSGGGGKPLLSPEPFLRAAERWGLAPALDRAVLDMAVAKAAEVGSGTVAVNLSALSLEDPSLPAYIAGR